VPNEISSDTRKELQDEDHGEGGGGGAFLKFSKKTFQIYFVPGGRPLFSFL